MPTLTQNEFSFRTTFLCNGLDEAILPIMMSDGHMSDGQNAIFSQHNQRQTKKVDKGTLGAYIPD